MKTFVSFIIKEAKHILRDKRTMLILFGMPVVLMLLFGFAITNDVRNVRTVVVTSSMDYQTQKAIERLKASEYFNITGTAPSATEAERMIRNQQADMAVVFTQQFAKGQVKGDAGIQFIVDAADPNMAQQWTTYATQTILLNTPSKLEGVHEGERSVFPIVNTKMLYNPQVKSAYNFVPAIMGMLLILICAMMTSVSIVREKERGTMEVLLVSPVEPLMIIISKAIPYLLQAVLILTIILTMSFTVLEVPLAGSLFWIIIVSVIYILLALSLGLLISNIAKTQFVALLMSAMILLLPTVMLSGMLFPVESMPKILQWIAAVIPPRYYIQAMRKLMIMGVGIENVLHEVTILCIMTVVLLFVALKTFNKRLSV